MNVSQYCALQSQKRDIVVMDDKMKELIFQLSKYGANLNQALMLVHSGKIKMINLGGVEKVLKDVWQLLNLLTEKTRRIQD